MSITKPNLKRENTLKVPLNDPEAAEIRTFCTTLGKHVAPFVRDLALAHIRKEANRSAGQHRSEGPRHGHPHGHVQRFPGRPHVAGTSKRLHL